MGTSAAVNDVYIYIRQLPGDDHVIHQYGTLLCILLPLH